jgi:uncharacterized SAM-dependent methyltransferase
MRYFKNSELARMYGISEKTVRNWIKSAQAGNLELDLYAGTKGRVHIAETIKNDQLIQKLVNINKKYTNSRTHKVISFPPEFYKTYSEAQQIDIVDHLEKFNEFPFHYVHMAEGAQICASYYDRLQNESAYNSQAYSSKVFLDYYTHITGLFQDLINVIELGGRTGLVLQSFIEKLDDQGKLAKYIDIDISNELLKRNEHNIKRSLRGDKYESYQRDITRERFTDVTMKNSTTANTANLVTLLAGTMSNFTDKSIAYKNIHRSLGYRDHLILTCKVDSPEARRYFDFDPTFNKKLITQRDLFLANMMGLDESYFEIEQMYDKAEKARKIQARLKFDITLTFELDGKTKKLEFSKGESILLWRVWHQTMDEIVQEMTECGFNVMQATKSPDEQYAMVIAKIRTDKVNHR